MVRRLPIKQGWYVNLSAGAGTWCDENFKGNWNFYGDGGTIYITIDEEEDLVLFVLKYGDYIGEFPSWHKLAKDREI